MFYVYKVWFYYEPAMGYVYVFYIGTHTYIYFKERIQERLTAYLLHTFSNLEH